MKCTNCGAEIPDSAKFCPECGNKIERKNFCPSCGTEVTGGKFCPECGAPLTAGAAGKPRTAEESEEDRMLEELTKSFDDLVAKKRQKEEKTDEYNRKKTAARTYVIREMYAEAKELYDGLLEDYPDDMEIYMGYVRIATKNYTEYEGDEIDKSIRAAQRMGGTEDLTKFDRDYAAFTDRRKQYFTKKSSANNRSREVIRPKSEPIPKSEPSAKADPKAETRPEAVTPKAVVPSGQSAGFEIKDGVLVKYRGRSADVVIPDGVTKIGETAFFGRKSLKSVVIPDGVTQIGRSAFYGCVSLKSVNIPDSVTLIDYSAFENCTSLTSITIPGSVKLIEFSAFSRCNGLTSITIQNGVTKICDRAFMMCNNVDSVVIPESVTAMGYHVFSICWGTTIYCRANSKPEGWADGWNADCEVVWGYRG